VESFGAVHERPPRVLYGPENRRLVGLEPLARMSQRRPVLPGRRLHHTCVVLVRCREDWRRAFSSFHFGRGGSRELSRGARGLTEEVVAGHTKPSLSSTPHRYTYLEPGRAPLKALAVGAAGDERHFEVVFEVLASPLEGARLLPHAAQHELPVLAEEDGGELEGPAILGARELHHVGLSPQHLCRDHVGSDGNAGDDHYDRDD